MKKKYSHQILKSFVFWSCAFVCLCFAQYMRPSCVNAAEVVDRIVAQVNGDIITLQDLENAVKPYEEKIKAAGYLPEKEQLMLYKASQDILNELINDKLTDQEVREEGISIKDSEIDEAVERVKEMNFFAQEQLVEALANDGMTLKDFRQNIREQLLRTRLVNLKVKSKIVITKEDIKKYYDEHPGKYAGKKQYHLRSLVKRVPEFSDEAQIQEILDEMESINTKLDQGESFETLARQHSDYLAEDAGDLGLFTLDELSPKIRWAIADLKTGEHSSVINTEQGFQIFYIEEIVEKPGKPIEEVSGEIEEILYKEVVDEKFKIWVEGLREKSHIKIIR